MKCPECNKNHRSFPDKCWAYSRFQYEHLLIRFYDNRSIPNDMMPLFDKAKTRFNKMKRYITSKGFNIVEKVKGV